MENREVRAMFISKSEAELLEMLDAGEFDLSLQDRTNIFVIACGGTSEAFVIAYINKYKDIDINDQPSPNSFALRNCIYDNKLGLLKFLLNKGANPDVCNHLKDTPLILACFLLNREIAKELIKYGADINIRGNNGETALMASVRQRDTEMMKVLLENNADVNITDIFNTSPLCYAVQHDDVKSIGILLKHNPDPNIVNDIYGPSILNSCQNDDIREMITEYLDRFNRLKELREEFKKETATVNRARKIMKASKIAKIKNVKKI